MPMLDKSITDGDDVSDASIGAAVAVRMLHYHEIGETVLRKDVLAGLLAGDDSEFQERIEQIIEMMAAHPEAPIENAVGGGSVQLTDSERRTAERHRREVHRFVQKYDEDDVVTVRFEVSDSNGE